MAKPKTEPYPKAVLDLMAEKTAVLTKAEALAAMGMSQTVLPVWLAAAAYEERLGPLLDALGREPEAALHRISAASCYRKAGDFSRAANLYRASLAGPLRKKTRREVQEMLDDCLAELTEATIGS